MIYLISKGGKPRGGKRTIGADNVIQAIFWSQLFGGGRHHGGGSDSFGSSGGFGGFSGGGGFGSGGGGAGGSW